MKKIFVIVFAICFFSCANKESNYPWSNLSLEEALALKSDKIIFIDFYSDNWGACNLLEAETLSDQRVIDLTNKHLIPIKIDAWYDTVGQKLFKKYNGYAIPLLMFIDSSGDEIERVVGYKNPDEFIEIINNVASNTIFGFIKLANIIIINKNGIALNTSINLTPYKSILPEKKPSIAPIITPIQ